MKPPGWWLLNSIDGCHSIRSVQILFISCELAISSDIFIHAQTLMLMRWLVKTGGSARWYFMMLVGLIRLTQHNLFVCFITKSFLTFFTNTCSTICRPLSNYLCSITLETAKVCRSKYWRGPGIMQGPGIGRWYSDRSSCNILRSRQKGLQFRIDISK